MIELSPIFVNVLKAGMDPIEIILFGSKARGDYTENSDIDVLVILNEYNQTNIDQIYSLVAKILVEYSVYISVKVWDYDNYLKMKGLNTPFILNMSKEGIHLE